jgi:hypothetical protein
MKRVEKIGITSRNTMFMTGHHHVSDLLSRISPLFFLSKGITTTTTEEKKKHNRKEALLCVICQSSVPFFPISNRDSFDIQRSKESFHPHLL